MNKLNLKIFVICLYSQIITQKNEAKTHFIFHFFSLLENK